MSLPIPRLTPPILRKNGVFRKLHPEPQRLEKGQIWTTIPEPRDMNGQASSPVSMSIPVMVWWAGRGKKTLDNIIRVIPLSLDTEFCMEPETVLLTEAESPLGYPILLTIFNERPMLAGNLGEYCDSLSEDVLSRVTEVRRRFLDGKMSKPDRDYIVWKDKEIELTKYLTFPVNEGLWEEQIEERRVKIPLLPYRKAADTTGVELSEIKPHVLMETDEFSLSIIQKRDQVLLRHVSDTIEPQYVRVDGEPKVMVRKQPGTFELILGEVDVVQGSSELQITLQGEQLTFQLQFKRNNGT